MSHDDSSEKKASAGVDTALVSAVSRRRLLRGGLKASPVLMTLASRPVLAATCVTASISVSAGSPGRVSNLGSPTCNGWAPAKWVNTVDSSWPAGCSGKLFSAVFGTSSYGNAATMRDVMNGTAANTEAADQQLLAKNLCAAWLNFTAGKTDPTVLGLTAIQNAWTQGRIGTYPVVGSPNWGPVKLNPWLTNMFAVLS